MLLNHSALNDLNIAQASWRIDIKTLFIIVLEWSGAEVFRFSLLLETVQAD